MTIWPNQRLKPQTICEIGVRAGYSAFTFLSANPSARMLGIEANLDERYQNTHGGRKDLYKHALEILSGFDYDVMLVNSRDIRRLPRFDLIYVDGDHSYEGCLADLELAAPSTDMILVDDYDSIDPVREACDEFATKHPEFTTEHIDSNQTGFMLFQCKK